MKSVSLKKNVIFNYFGQFYSTFIGIIVFPLFLKYMGPEAYGLIGFFTVIEALLRLLDMGMAPTLAREVSRLKGKADEHWRLVTVVNSIELLFIVLAIIASLILFFARNWIASSWLTVESLSVDVVSSAISIIALIIAVRWVTALNRSGINAYEAQVWMNVVDVILNTLRFPGSLLVVIYMEGNILFYFYFHLIVNILGLLVVRLKIRDLLPKNHLKNVKIFSFSEVRRIAPYAFGIGYSAICWVLLTQLDKLLLSKYLKLSEYGFFTLVGVLVSGLLMLANPVGKAILPRMTAMVADGEGRSLLFLYKNATRFVSSCIFPLGFIMAMNANVVIYTWTGNHDAAQWVEKVLPLFVLGGMLQAVSTFQYYLQCAYGQLKYHVGWSTASTLIVVPLIAISARVYGAEGVGWVWLVYQFFTFILFGAYIHHKFAPGVHAEWVIKDVLFPGFIALLLVVLFYLIVPLSVETGRVQLGIELVVITIVTVLTTAVVVFKKIIFNRQTYKSSGKRITRL